MPAMGRNVFRLATFFASITLSGCALIAGLDFTDEGVGAIGVPSRLNPELRRDFESELAPDAPAAPPPCIPACIQGCCRICSSE